MTDGVQGGVRSAGGRFVGRFLRFEMPRPAPRPILALGGELKAAICLYSGREAALSESLGNLSEPAAFRAFAAFVEQAPRELGVEPEAIACDLHPRYLSTQLALRLGRPVLRVQHHHAHLLSVLADQQISGPAVGIVADGVGYGADGAAWGGEVLYGDASGFQRIGHLDYFYLIGGDAAAVDTTRPAAALLRQAFGDEWREHLPPALAALPPETLEQYERIMARPTASLWTSSLGRVFDGISALVGLCLRNDREAQAAIALEAAAGDASAEPYPCGLPTEAQTIRMSVAPMVRAVVRDLRAGRDVGEIAAGFHEAVAVLLAAAAELAAEQCGTDLVALSGGCLANRRLRARLTECLERRRLRVLVSQRASCGDAALALGQASAAAAWNEEV